MSRETRIYVKEGKRILKDFIKRSRRKSFEEVSDMFEKISFLSAFGPGESFEFHMEAHRLAKMCKEKEAKTLLIKYVKAIQHRLLFL
jgi:hypothetical protein